MNTEGAALTNAHVVEGCEQAKITGYGKARIVATSRDELIVATRDGDSSMVEGPADAAE